jgi:hypothetical protein
MILERRLRFTPTGSNEFNVLVIQIGEPTFPARTPGMERFFGCSLDYGLRGVRPHEVFGVDAMQASGAALAAIHIFIREMAKKGVWSWEDGRPYKVEDDAPVPLSSQEAVRTANTKIEGNRSKSD